MAISSSRVLIAAAVPIVALSFASFGRTGAAARDIIRVGSVRRAESSLDTHVRVPDVPLPLVRAPRPSPEAHSFRNPFEFAPRSLPANASSSPVVLQPPPPALPDVPPSVVLSLIGVAATSLVDGRVERTAIITGPADALYLVREGDAVMSRYRVERVQPDSLRLVDSLTGAPVILILR